jgi:hypothetical protein
MSRLRLLALSGALALPLAPGPAHAQCAMCKTAVSGSAEGRQIGATLNRAILVMVASPYLVAGALTALFLRRRIAASFRRWLGLPPARPPHPGA